MQVDDKSFESSTDFVNLSLQLFDCSPLKALKPNRTVKLGKKKIKDVIVKFNKAVAVAINQPLLESDGEPESGNCSWLRNLI